MQERLAFKIFRNDSVIADQRKCLQDNLSGIAWVRQGFNIPAHVCGKHQFTDLCAGSTKGPAFKD